MSKDEKSIIKTLSLVYDYVVCVNDDGDISGTSDGFVCEDGNIYGMLSQVDFEKMDAFLDSDEGKMDDIFAIFNPDLPIKWGQISRIIQEGYKFLCIKDYTQEYENQRSKQFESKYDALTNTLRRDDLDNILEEIDSEANHPITFIMFDVNGVKLTNDAFGYNEGDTLLKKCATIIKNASDSSCKLFRMNGDEFLLVCPKTDKAASDKILESIDQMCKEETESMVPPSFSIGLSIKESIDQNTKLLLRKAEQALYADRIVESTNYNASIIQNLKNHLSKKNFETAAHISRVKGLALTLGDELSLTHEQLNTLSIAAELHDIGKVSVPENILDKQGPLTNEEWEIIKLHPVTSYRIIFGLGDMFHVAEIVLHHHERYDGTGYPSGLEGEEIPLLARILTLVDSYDNMLNSPYVKKKMDTQGAIAEVKKCTGKQFDPVIAGALMKIIKKE